MKMTNQSELSKNAFPIISCTPIRNSVSSTSLSPFKGVPLEKDFFERRRIGIINYSFFRVCLSNLFLFFFFLFPLSLFAQIDFTESTLVQKNFLERIPFEFTANKIILKAKIAGKEGRFLLDTGAPTIISKAFQQSLQLPDSGTIDVRDATNQVQRQAYVVLPSISLGNLKFSNGVALVLDFQQTVVADEGLEIDGFIGSNLFQDIIIQFQLEQKELLLTDRKEKLNLQEAKTTKMKLSQIGQPYIPIKVDGVKELALFDTGFPDVLAITAFFYQKNKKRLQPYRLSKTENTISYEGIYGGETKGENLPLLRLPTVTIGKKTLEKIVTLPAYLNETLVGTELLRYGIVTLDYKNQKFYLRQGGRSTNQ